MDLPAKRGLVLLLGVIMFSAILPGYVQAPPDDYNNHIILVQGNTLSFLSVSHQTLQIQSYGVLSGGVEYYELISKYSWDSDLMYRIFMAESRLNPNAVNWKDRHRGCSGSFGIAQIGCIHFGKYGINENNWHIPEVNIAAAYQIFLNDGLNAWGAFTNGSYLKF